MYSNISILFLLLFTSCFKDTSTAIQQIHEPISSHEIYDIINSVLHEKPIERKPNWDFVAERPFEELSLSKTDSLAIIKLDTIFSTADIAFIYEQLKNGKKFKISQKDIKGKKVIPFGVLEKFALQKNNNRSFWDFYQTKYGKSGYKTVSLPLLSLNHHYAIIKITNNFFQMNESGGTFIYKNEHGKWILIKELQAWLG